MHVMTNELSFVAQAISFADANKLMDTFLQVIVTLEKTYGKLFFYRHSSFANRELSLGYTVRECAKSVTQQQLRRFLLELITKGPYIDYCLGITFPNHTCTFNSDNVAGSSLAGIALLNKLSDSKLVSLQGAADFAHACIRVQASTHGAPFEDYDICNITLTAQVKTLCRPYQLIAKHKSPGGWGTHMDLDDDTAQMVLNKGIKKPDGKQIYGYYNGCFYEFQPDGTGQCPGKPDTYHGYPVPENQVPASVVCIMQECGIV